MALNWTMLNANRIPVPLPQEMSITSVDSGVEVNLTIPDTPPTPRNDSSGGSGGTKRLKAMGRLWLSDQRLVFVAVSGAAFESLSVPLPSILSTRFEQPTFGANYLSFDVNPSPEGGLSDGTKAEIRFKDRAMFEFVSLLEKTRERAIYMKRQAAEEELDGPPTYTMPAGSSSVTMVGGVPIDNPPGYDV
ncbi:hypothetical protein AX16_007395 [Volvariella volvacea WC 439]|nr:hypothetical protein AX16_007395 [Volvariella volvacea WC 439]